jgi:microcin C transport system substrate-binding protein
VYTRYWETHHGSNAYTDAYLDANGQPVDTFAAGKPNPNPTQVRVQTNNMTMTFQPELDQVIEAYDRARTMDEIKELAAQAEMLIYQNASWVNGWALPFHRTGYWRYVKWPKDFNVMQSRSAEEFFLHWIDEDERKATEDARRRGGQTFPPQVLVFDQYQ